MAERGDPPGAAPLLPADPAAGLGLPREAGDSRLEALAWRPIHVLRPLGPAAALADALQAALGLPMPPRLGSVAAEGAEAVWFGHGATALIGPPAARLAPLWGVAAVVEVSDGWMPLRLSGGDAEAVLARLCPLDPAAMAQGAAAFAEVAHVRTHLTRQAAGWRLLVPRSYSGTVVAETARAMASVAAQRRLTQGRGDPTG